MIPISFTSGRLFETCPARFRAEKVRVGDGSTRVSAPKSHPMQVGIFMHRALEFYLKELIQKGAASDYDAMSRIFESEWAASGTQFVESDYGELQDLMVKTREGISLEHPEQVIGAELALALDRDWRRVDWDSPAAFLRMRLDRLEVDESAGRVLVWDYKTGYKMIEAKDSLQLKLYAAAARKIINAAPGVVFVGELFFAREELTKSAEFTEADLNEGMRWAEGIFARVQRAEKANAWPATVGAGCMECPIFDDCAEAKKGVSDLPPRDMTEARALAGRLIVVDREYGSLAERLKLWITANGPVDENGMLVEMALCDKREFPMAALKDVLDRYGIELLPVLKADTKALRKAARKNAPLQADLDAIAVDHSYRKFQLRRIE